MWVLYISVLNCLSIREKKCLQHFYKKWETILRKLFFLRFVNGLFIDNDHQQERWREEIIFMEDWCRSRVQIKTDNQALRSIFHAITRSSFYYFLTTPWRWWWSTLQPFCTATSGTSTSTNAMPTSGNDSSTARYATIATIFVFSVFESMISIMLSLIYLQLDHTCNFMMSQSQTC